MKKIFIISFSIITFCTIISCANYSYIRATIVDKKTKEPIKGLEIYIYHLVPFYQFERKSLNKFKRSSPIFTNPIYSDSIGQIYFYEKNPHCCGFFCTKKNFLIVIDNPNYKRKYIRGSGDITVRLRRKK